MLYRDNVHADLVGYPTPGSRSLTQVRINVHCCHCLPKELSNKGYQLIRGSKVLKFLLSITPIVSKTYSYSFIQYSESIYITLSYIYIYGMVLYL